jgi:hypothetical protein
MCCVMNEIDSIVVRVTQHHDKYWHFIPEGVVETSQIFLQDTHILR